MIKAIAVDKFWREAAIYWIALALGKGAIALRPVRPGPPGCQPDHVGLVIKRLSDTVDPSPHEGLDGTVLTGDPTNAAGLLPKAHPELSRRRMMLLQPEIKVWGRDEGKRF